MVYTYGLYFGSLILGTPVRRWSSKASELSIYLDQWSERDNFRLQTSVFKARVAPEIWRRGSDEGAMFPDKGAVQIFCG